MSPKSRMLLVANLCFFCGIAILAFGVFLAIDAEEYREDIVDDLRVFSFSFCGFLLPRLVMGIGVMILPVGYCWASRVLLRISAIAVLIMGSVFCGLMILHYLTQRIAVAPDYYEFTDGPFGTTEKVHFEHLQTMSMMSTKDRITLSCTFKTGEKKEWSFHRDFPQLIPAAMGTIGERATFHGLRGAGDPWRP